jgi:hypothetical protein
MENTPKPIEKKLLEQVRDVVRAKHRVAYHCGPTPIAPNTPTSSSAVGSLSNPHSMDDPIHASVYEVIR